MPKKIGGIIMLSKIRALKEKKGFTLVELIVVLVILAILAALLIPALTGYIDKANKEKVTAEARMVVMAAQTEASEVYATVAQPDADKMKTALTAKVGDIAKLAEVKGTWTVSVDASGKITKVVYGNSGWVCTYRAADETTGEGEAATKVPAGYSVVKGAAPEKNAVA